MTRFLGAILAGGASSRMGQDKALVDIAGRSMGAWVSEALAGAVGPGRTIALGGTRLEGVPRVEDHPGEGPLSGLAAVADAPDRLGIRCDAVLLVAVDQPWAHPETLRRLTDLYHGRPVVPLHHRVLQVTCAVYPISVATAASQGAATGKGLQALLDPMDVDRVSPETWAEWDEDGRSWFSVDEPRDVRRGLERFGPPGHRERRQTSPDRSEA